MRFEVSKGLSVIHPVIAKCKFFSVGNKTGRHRYSYRRLIDTYERLETICQRRRFLEAHLRTHYPNLRNGDSLFHEFDPQSFVVLPQGLFCVSGIPPGWGVLIDSDNNPVLARRSLRNETTPQRRLDFFTANRNQARET